MFGMFKRQSATDVAPTPTPDPSRRIYAVGDVHGRYDLLAALVDRLAVDAARFDDEREAVAVFLGDYVDRGDHSREVLAYLSALEAEGASAVFLRGNHEEALLDFLDNPVRAADWLGYGGLQTLASYGVAPTSVSAGETDLRRAAGELADAMGPHVAFLERTVPMFRSGDVVCTHAGIDPDLPLDEQTDRAMLWGRSTFLEAGGVDGLRVVHGHWPASDPVVTPRRVCLDTGAFYSGRLTAIRLDASEEIIQIDALALV